MRSKKRSVRSHVTESAGIEPESRRESSRSRTEQGAEFRDAASGIPSGSAVASLPAAAVGCALHALSEADRRDRRRPRARPRARLRHARPTSTTPPRSPRASRGCAASTSIRYAQKANSNLAILDLMRRHGVLVDAVSAGEIQRALAAGYTAARRSARRSSTPPTSSTATRSTSSSSTTSRSTAARPR